MKEIEFSSQISHNWLTSVFHASRHSRPNIKWYNYIAMSIKETFHKHFWRIGFFVLLAILAILLIWVTVDVHSLYQTGALRPTRGFRRTYIQTPLSSPTQIQDWMTFSYINHIFNLPPQYLSTALTIQDSQYPNLQISQYAKTKNLNDADFLKQVQQLVSQYLQGSH